MKNFDQIKELAAGDFGLVTAAQVRELGIASFQLARWVKMDWLEKSARGVYRVSDYPASEYDPFAVAVESVGPEAMICGESVLGMLQLTDTNPTWIHVGTASRKRRTLSDGIRLEALTASEKPEYYEGVRCQSVPNAIRQCKGRISPERLREAVDNAYRNGYIMKHEVAGLRREIDA